MAQFTLDGVTYSRFQDIPGAVYTRSGVEYQQNQAGLLVPFDEDVPPISAGVGVDVWQGATNILLRSTDLSQSPWQTSANSSVTANYALAPDGTMTATRAQRSAAGGPNFLVRQYVTVTAQAYTMSVYIKSNTGQNQSGGLRYYDNVTSAAIGITATPVWQRVTFPITSTGSGPNFQFDVDFLSAGADVLVWGAQLEAGSFATPYIPTTNAAATRGAPSMYINAPGLIVPSLGVTVVVDVTWPRSLTSTGIFVEPAGVAGFSLCTNDSGTKPRAVIRQGAARIDTGENGPTVTHGSRVKLALSFDGISTALASAQGTTLASSFTPAQIDYAGSATYFGSRGGSALFMNGAINSISFLKGLRTQAELNALTA